MVNSLVSDFDPVEYLFNLQHFGIKLGIDRMEKFCELLGHPEKKFKIIHVAGTNGKGSVCSMLASILQAAGYKVGLYTSPHLEAFNERIKINGEEISDNELKRLTLEIKNTVADSETTFFEFTTAVAFSYFAEQKVDYVILEVGLGGRLDATNVVTPIVSVITSIDFDHTKILGETLEEIALEKAGIIKENVPVVCGENNSDLQELFRNVCLENNSELFFVDKEYKLIDSTLSGQCFLTGGNEYNLSLLGEHQIENALTTIKTVEILKKQGVQISIEAVKQGLKLVKWDGRLQVYSQKPLIIFDGAHNPSGIKALDQFLASHNDELFLHLGKNRKSVCIIGISSGKDVGWMLKKLSSYFNHIIITQASHRGIPKEELFAIAKPLFSQVEVCEFDKAVLLARKIVGHDGFILVTGSLYLVGDILKTIRGTVDSLKLTGAIRNV